MHRLRGAGARPFPDGHCYSNTLARLLPCSCGVIAMLLQCYCRPHDGDDGYDDDEQRHLEKNKKWTTFGQKKLVPSHVHPGLADSRSDLNNQVITS